jgi:hypothetical protein
MIFSYAIDIDKGLLANSPDSSEDDKDVIPLSYKAAQVCILSSFNKYGSASPSAP